MTPRIRKILSSAILMLATVAVRAETVGINDSVIDAMNRAKSGDTVYITKGVHVVSGPIVHRSGITLTGEPGGGSVLKFVGVNSTGIAYSFDPGAQNVVVTQIKFDGSTVWLRGSTNATFYGFETTNVPKGCAGIWSNGNNKNLRIERYWPHDFAHWGILLDGRDDNAVIQDCVATNVYQLIHAFVGNNQTLSHNAATGLGRMMIELQQRNSYVSQSDAGLKVTENACWDWNTLYWDSFGYSIMPQSMKNVTFVGNYARMNKLGGWERADSAGTFRAGIGMELGFDPRSSTVSGNIIGSNVKMWTPIISSVDGLKIDGTQIYCDAAMYPAFAGESGVNIPGIGDGVGSCIPTNTINSRYTSTDGKTVLCPPPPKWAQDRIANPAAWIYNVEDSGQGSASSINPVTPHQVGYTVVFDGQLPGAQIHYRTIGGQWLYIGPSNVFTATPDMVANTWKLEFRQVLNSTESPVSSIQLSPVTTPATLPTDELIALRAQVEALTAAGRQADTDLAAGKITIAARDATIADLRGRLDAIEGILKGAR